MTTHNSGQTAGDQDPIRNFDQAAVHVHSEVPMNSPLADDLRRTNLELTNLMHDYIAEALHENGRYDALVSNSVLTDFMRWIAYQDTTKG